MSTDDSHYTLPGGGGASFSKTEWERAKRNIEKMREKLAKTCKHLIKSTDKPKPRKIDWAKAKEERERLEQKERDAQREANGYD